MLKFLYDVALKIEIEINEIPFVMGSSKECNYVIADQSISREEVEIDFEMDAVKLRILSSNSETYLNKMQLFPFQDYTLKDGDELQIGSSVFLYNCKNKEIEKRKNEKTIIQKMEDDQFVGLNTLKDLREAKNSVQRLEKELENVREKTKFIRKFEKDISEKEVELKECLDYLDERKYSDIETLFSLEKSIKNLMRDILEKENEFIIKISALEKELKKLQINKKKNVELAKQLEKDIIIFKSKDNIEKLIEELKLELNSLKPDTIETLEDDLKAELKFSQRKLSVIQKNYSENRSHFNKKKKAS